MTMNIKVYEFSNLSKDFKIGLKDYSSIYSNGIPLKEFLVNKSYELDIKSGRTPSKFNLDYWNGEHDFITMSDVNTKLYVLNEDTQEFITDEAIENEKTLYKVQPGSLIVSNAMTIGLSFIVDREVFINQNVFHINVNDELINRKFLLWYFNIFIRRQLEKTYSAKYLSKRELSRINIPNIDIDDQIDFESSIKPIECEITELEKQIKPVSYIIDEVFGEFFGFNYQKFNSLKRVKGYNCGLHDYSRDIDMRYSVKFHRPAGLFVIYELNRITDKKIKDFITIPLMTGKGIRPNDYASVESEYKYASMADISEWFLDEDKMRLITDSYVLANSSKRPKGYKDTYTTTIQKGDILMNRSGEGSIGKVALVENDINAIYADFVIRIRLVNYNPLFAYYYFRTTYFQYLIEIYKKGLGNNTNIFPVVLQNSPIPNISLEEQEKLISTIYCEIEKIRVVEDQINQKRLEIENMLNHIVKGC